MKALFFNVLIVLSSIIYLQGCNNKEEDVVLAVPPTKQETTQVQKVAKKRIATKSTPSLASKSKVVSQKETAQIQVAQPSQKQDSNLENTAMVIDSVVLPLQDTAYTKIEVKETKEPAYQSPIANQKLPKEDSMYVGYDRNSMLDILGVSESSSTTFSPKQEPMNCEYNVLQIGPLIGTDVGGGVPFGNIPKDFRPYPKLNISLGLWFNYIINKHWQVGITATYKTVALAADARMRNEYFAAAVPALTGNNEVVRVYYTGKARQSMSFTMLEFPLLAKYGFGSKGQYRVVFGGYGAWIMDRSFLVTAKTGYQGFSPNEIGVIIPKEGLALDFSNTLRNWEAGLVLGYEQAITSRLSVDFTVYGGLNDIVKQGERFLTYGMFPMRLGVHASYSLFEFAPAEDKKCRFVYK